METGSRQLLSSARLVGPHLPCPWASRCNTPEHKSSCPPVRLSVRPCMSWEVPHAHHSHTLTHTHIPHRRSPRGLPHISQRGPAHHWDAGSTLMLLSLLVGLPHSPIPDPPPPIFPCSPLYMPESCPRSTTGRLSLSPIPPDLASYSTPFLPQLLFDANVSAIAFRVECHPTASKIATTSTALPCAASTSAPTSRLSTLDTPNTPARG